MTTNKYDWTNKEQIISDLKQSCSTSEFLDQNGLVCSSGNYDTFKKWLKFHDIKKEDYFKPKEKKPLIVKLEQLDKVILTKEEVLCQNSIYTRKDANRIIRNENLLPYKCSGCSNEGEWNGQPLTLQLEHKNGDSCDHRIENLEYLCPNCHSQTNTYGSKNKHNRVFEERVKDILAYETIGRSETEKLAEKWKIESSSVKDWIKLYKEKIKLIKNINFDWQVDDNNVEIIEKRLQQLNQINISSKSWKKELQQLWGLSDNGVKKWIRNYAPEFFNNNYILSPRNKVKLYEQNLHSQINNILNQFKIDKKFQIEKLLPLFNNNSGACISYIRRKFINQYNYFYPIPSCKNCGSENVARFGLRKLKSGNLQRYKCNQCNEQFCENN